MNIENLQDKKKTLSDEEMTKLQCGSFFRHVPELVLSGLSIDEAVKIAYEREELMLIEIQIVAGKMSSGGFKPYTDKEKSYAALIEQISLGLWIKFNKNQEKI